MNPRILAPILVALLLLVGGCSRPETAGKSVILITLDTTRADHLGAYGHPDVRTPLLDRLARQGALIQDGVADVPVTLPSHTTMMTGVPTLGHGVRFNADFKVSEDAETLAELYAEIGYDTGAVVSSLVLLSKFGLAQGFDHYDDALTPGYVKHDEELYPDKSHWLPKADRRATETVDRSLDWLRRRSKRPFLFWAHFYDPHFPYDPPPPWGDAHPNRYLAEIQYTDRELARLIRTLDREGLTANAVILVTADHGEGLDQHREDGHGIFLYDETVRVPMIVRAPGSVRPGTLIAEQARTIDLAPTLLELSGHPNELGIGGSLVPLLDGTGPAPGELAYCESMKTRLFYGGSGLKSIRTKDAKFVWAPLPELYDLEADPGETINLASEDAPRASALREALEDLVRHVLGRNLATVEAANADQETLEGLRSLGYLSGSDGGVRPGPFEVEMDVTGNDPKDLVDVSMSARDIENGFYEGAEKKLRRFFRTARSPESDPRMARLHAAAYQNYAKIWMVRGRFADAAEAYRRATRVDPTYESARWSRIYALNLAGSHDLAASESGTLVTQFPKAWRVRLHRGLALALLGQPKLARAELGVIVEHAPPTHPATKNARYFFDRIGTPDEESALRAYLASNSRGKPKS